MSTISRCRRVWAQGQPARARGRQQGCCLGAAYWLPVALMHAARGRQPRGQHTTKLVLPAAPDSNSGAPSTCCQPAGGASPSGMLTGVTWLSDSRVLGRLARVTLMAGEDSTSRGPPAVLPMMPKPWVRVRGAGAGCRPHGTCAAGAGEGRQLQPVGPRFSGQASQGLGPPHRAAGDDLERRHQLPELGAHQGVLAHKGGAHKHQRQLGVVAGVIAGAERAGDGLLQRLLERLRLADMRGPGEAPRRCARGRPPRAPGRGCRMAGQGAAVLRSRAPWIAPAMEEAAVPSVDRPAAALRCCRAAAQVPPELQLHDVDAGGPCGGSGRAKPITALLCVVAWLEITRIA
jgi:hypothetical protein